MNAIPFGLRGDRLYEVDKVERGLACNCVCPDPKCQRPLVARHGTSGLVAWHFAHLGDAAGISPGCSGGETALHRFAKQYLCESVGKVFPLPDLSGMWITAIRITKAAPEVAIDGTNRRCDVLIDGLIRRQVSDAWDTRARLAVELAVTNPKDAAYIKEVAAAGKVSVVEILLTYKEVERKAATHKLHIAWSEAVKQLLMGTWKNRRWLYKRPSPLGADGYD